MEARHVTVRGSDPEDVELDEDEDKEMVGLFETLESANTCAKSEYQSYVEEYDARIDSDDEEDGEREQFDDFEHHFVHSSTFTEEGHFSGIVELQHELVPYHEVSVSEVEVS